MTAAVLTPFTAAEAVELGNRLWRKRLLPVGDVEYKGRTLHFTPKYLGQLVTAFQNRAYDQVPFQLADAQNTHTNDPERTRGWVKGMELGDDGLYVTAEVNEAGEQVLAANPNLGVSARIVEDYARSDGQFFKSAVQHVLGTLDPRIPGLGAWEAIEAASPVPDRVLDLTAESFTDLAEPQDKADRKAAKAQRKAAKKQTTDPAGDGTDTEGEAVMADLGNLSDTQKARLARLLDFDDETLDALVNGGVVVTPEELDALTAPDHGEADEDEEGGLAAEIDAMTDEELAALEAEFDAQSDTDDTEGETPDRIPEGEPVAAGMSAEAQFEINLANAKADETARELAVITARLREQDYLAEKRKLSDLGVPPMITELARPLLEGAGRTVELANGKSADAGQIVRRVLTEYAQMARLLDLDVELGSPMDEPEDAGREEQAQSRQALVSNFKNMTGL
jgi:hypothetical protein